jgi:DNA invertase Pin-like site-specific DNA recombinase
MTQVKCALYTRVSTLLGQDPQHQVIPLQEFCGNRGFSVVRTYTDYISGTKERRPALDQLIKDARMGKFKILVVYALDRLGRNTLHLLSTVQELESYGVSLISLRESLDFTTPVGKACLSIFAAVSALERDLISERIKTALAAKKIISRRIGSNWRCGRPLVATDDIKAEVLRLNSDRHSIRQIVKLMAGRIGRSSVARIINESKQVSQKPMQNLTEGDAKPP